MDVDRYSVSRRLDKIEQRLERLEQLLGAAEPAPEPEAPQSPAAPDRAAPPISPTVQMSSEVADARVARAARPAPPVAPPTAPPTGPPPIAPSPVLPKVPATPAMHAPSRDAKRGTGLEMKLGISAAAWAGAIVIVIGAAFLVKLGYQSDWWASLSTTVKSMLVAGFGALLTAGGEIAYRKVGRAASVGLFGAGLGTLYLDAFAAFEWFNPPVVSPNGAFMLMGLVALIGFALTLRTRSLTIGVLSLIGGYMTPVLLYGGLSNVGGVGAYLTMLLGVSLALSATMPKPFRALRYVALVGQGLLGLGWALESTSTHWLTVLVMISIWWAAVMGECLLAAMRNQSLHGNPIALVGATAWYVTLGCFVMKGGQPAGFDWLGTFTVMVGGAAAAVAATFGPPIAQVNRPRSAIARLAVALWAQAGVLLAVAVALQFDGYGQSIGWLAIGAASVETGRRLRKTPVQWFGLIVGALAVVRVGVLDWRLAGLGTNLATVSGVNISGWSILAVITILTMHATAQRLQPSWKVMPPLIAFAATFGWMGVCGVQCTGWASPTGWLVAPAVLLALDRWGIRQLYLPIALTVLVMTALLWTMLSLDMRLSTDFVGGVPLLNAQMGVAAAMVALGWWSARKLAGRALEDLPPVGAGAWQVMFLAMTGLLLAGFSLEIDRVIETVRQSGRTLAIPFGQLRQLLLTMLWAGGSVAVGMLARVLITRRTDVLRVRGPDLLVRFAWALLILCAVKWLAWDTLFWTATARAAGFDVTPLVNVQMLGACVLAASAVLLRVLTVGRRPRPGLSPVAIVAPAACLLLLWGLSFEVDRIVGRWERTHDPVWDPRQLRALCWTALWAAGGLAMMLWSLVRRTQGMSLVGWGVLVVCAGAWLTIDTVSWRIVQGATAANVVFNLQFIVGVLVAGMIVAALWHLHRRPEPSLSPSVVLPTGLVAIGLIGLWLGSLEIDRFFSATSTATAAMARQTGLSIWWGVYAIGLISIGFAKRTAAARYAGLALLALTLGKVVTIDLAEVRSTYRVLSFIGVGLLLVATSIAYAKLAPRLDPRPEKQ